MSDIAASIAAPSRQIWRDAAASIRLRFHDHIPLYACTIVFGTITWVVCSLYGVTLSLDPSIFFLKVVGLFCFAVITACALGKSIVMMRTGSDEAAHIVLGRWFAEKFLTGDRPGNMVHAILALTPLMIGFSAMKDVIPLIHPFSWDQTFMEWGRIIGFGTLPWQWLQPLFGYAPVTAGLNFVYDAWLLVLFVSLFWQAFAARASLSRCQFLLAFAFSWFFAGNVLAVIFSSAGPCFYGYLHPGADPYAAQMAYLNGVNAHWPVWSLNVQQALWLNYTTGAGEISGISAFPSMHVTSTVLIALIGWRTNKRLGAALWVFTGLIVIGSVHLAWHYAADSLGGIALALLFWWCAGFVARKWARRAQIPGNDERVTC